MLTDLFNELNINIDSDFFEKLEFRFRDNFKVMQPDITNNGTPVNESGPILINTRDFTDGGVLSRTVHDINT